MLTVLNKGFHCDTVTLYTKYYVHVGPALSSLAVLPTSEVPFPLPNYSSTPCLIFDFCESVGFIRVTHRSGSGFHWSVEISPQATILKKMSLPPPTNIGYSQTTADLIIASSLCDVMRAPSTCGFNAGNRSCCELKGGHGVPFLLVFTFPPPHPQCSLSLRWRVCGYKYLLLG